MSGEDRVITPLLMSGIEKAPPAGRPAQLHPRNAPLVPAVGNPMRRTEVFERRLLVGNVMRVYELLFRFDAV